MTSVNAGALPRYGTCRMSIPVIDLSNSMATCPVPPLILQPLVENAVVHGLARRSGAMRLTLDARRDGTRVTIVIAHDGADMPVDWTPASRNGVGVNNTRARLASVFRGAAELIVRRRVGGGVESVLSVPAPVETPASAPTPQELQPA